jgi:elongation factor Ts
MTDISAAMVMKLRKMSGQGMMDCKKALQETNGDIEKAMDVLRKKGLATLAKRAERDTSEGIVILTEGENWASLATLCCETDFVARSDDFMSTVDFIKNYVEKCEADSGTDAILETEIDGKKGSEIVAETVSKTGEKMVIGDYQRFYVSKTSLIGTYIHFNGKVGAMVEIEANDENTAAASILKQAASDIAMHITATKPLALDKDQVEPETIEREKAIFAEQVKNKPANIIDKIVEGKMKKFYIDNCLLEQPFVKDDSKSVEQVLNEAAKQAGGQAKIKRFVRFEVG